MQMKFPLQLSLVSVACATRGRSNADLLLDKVSNMGCREDGCREFMEDRVVRDCLVREHCRQHRHIRCSAIPELGKTQCTDSDGNTVVAFARSRRRRSVSLTVNPTGRYSDCWTFEVDSEGLHSIDRTGCPLPDHLPY